MSRISNRALRVGAVSVTLLSVSAVVGYSLASSALFTSSSSTSAAPVTAGTVTLTPTDATFVADLGAAAMAPGDTKYTKFTVANGGTLALRYAVTESWTSANALSAAVSLSVRTIASAGAACDGSLTWGSADLATNVTTATTSGNVVGDPTTGAQTGDRPLATSGTEYLCVREQLPLATTTGAGLSSNLSLTFAGEQTANN